MVVGVIFLGLATPSESAASGALGTFLLACFQGRMNWNVFKKKLGTIKELKDVPLKKALQDGKSFYKLTIKVKKIDLETNYFEKSKEEKDKKQDLD